MDLDLAAIWLAAQDLCFNPETEADVVHAHDVFVWLGADETD